MQCPLCPDSPLEPKFVGATEVDICPRCRGIWLDRGELDRLLGDGGDGDDRRRDDRGRYDDRDDRHRDDRGRYDDRYDDRRADRDRYDDRYDDGRSGRPKGKKSKAKRLADLFEEVLDF